MVVSAEVTGEHYEPPKSTPIPDADLDKPISDREEEHLKSKEMQE